MFKLVFLLVSSVALSEVNGYPSSSKAVDAACVPCAPSRLRATSGYYDSQTNSELYKRGFWDCCIRPQTLEDISTQGLDEIDDSELNSRQENEMVNRVLRDSISLERQLREHQSRAEKRLALSSHKISSYSDRLAESLSSHRSSVGLNVDEAELEREFDELG